MIPPPPPISYTHLTLYLVHIKADLHLHPCKVSMCMCGKCPLKAWVREARYECPTGPCSNELPACNQSGSVLLHYWQAGPHIPTPSHLHVPVEGKPGGPERWRLVRITFDRPGLTAHSISSLINPKGEKDHFQSALILAAGGV